MSESVPNQFSVPIIKTLPKNAMVIDVRHPDETCERPLTLPDARVQSIPYYQIQQDFNHLDPNRVYWLYCDRGIMSRLHAELLAQAGYRNLGVFKPQGNPE